MCMPNTFKWSSSIVLYVYGMFFYIVLTPISTTSGLWSTGNTRKYHQIDVYIYQCGLATHLVAADYHWSWCNRSTALKSMFCSTVLNGKITTTINRYRSFNIYIRYVLVYTKRGGSRFACSFAVTYKTFGFSRLHDIQGLIDSDHIVCKYPYCVYASSEGSCETGLMRRLAWAFA